MIQKLKTCPDTNILSESNISVQSDLRDNEAWLEGLTKKNRSPIALATAQEYAKEMGFEAYLECSALTQKVID